MHSIARKSVRTAAGSSACGFASPVAFALLMLHMPLLLLGSELGWVEFGNLHGVTIMLAVCLFGAWIVHLKVERPRVRRLAGSPAHATSRGPRMPGRAPERILQDR